MTPTECPTAADLADFHAGRLADARIDAVAQHLDTCAGCRAAPAGPALPPTDSRPARTRFDDEPGCGLARQRVGGIAPAGPDVGRVVGDFRLLGELGRGGMGVVYEAEQQSLGRRVAVKVLLHRGAADPHAMRRFEREAKAVGRLHHTNIVPVFGVGEIDGAPFYAMQLIRGAGLNDVIDALGRRRRGAPAMDTLADRLAAPLGFRESAALIAQAAAGVGHAHEQGVLHRDIKPSNLLLDAHGTVWVTDFGLAKTDDAADLTQTGDVLGTLRYMPPEAFDGAADCRSDVYALGLTLYEVLAARPAFAGADRGQVVRAVMEARPPTLRSLLPNLPKDLETVVGKAIDRDPARRYPTAAALAEDLRRFVRGEPIRARRLGPAERLSRWATHNRGLAAALAGLAVTLVGVTAGSLVAAGQYRAMANEQTALAAAEAAQRRLAEAAENAARANLYAAEMGVAARVAELPTGLPRLRELVSHWDPPAEGRLDPRGWEWRLFREQARQEKYVLSGRDFRAVAWSPDGSRLAVNVDAAIELLDPTIGATLTRFPGVHPFVDSMRYSRDGRRLVVGDYGGAIRLLDAATGETVYRATHGTAVTSVCLHPDGVLLASHGSDGTVRIHDTAAGREVAALPNASAGPPAEFGFSPDGRRLATLHRDGPGNRDAVAVWDTADWTKRFAVPAGDVVTTVRWLDDRRLVVGLCETGVLVWDTETKKPVHRWSTERTLVAAVDVAANGKRVAAGDWHRVLWVWDAETSRTVAVCGGHTANVYRVALSPDGTRVASVASEGTTSELRLWDLAGHQPVRTLDSPTPGKLPLDAGLAWHPDGALLAAGSPGGQSALCDARGTAAGSRTGLQLTWDRTGRRAAAQFNADVFLYEAPRADPVRTLRLPGAFKALAWNPVDDRLAIRVGYQLWVCDPSRADDPTLIFGEPNPPDPLPYHQGVGCAWHPNGRTVAFAAPGDDGFWVYFIDPATRTVVSKFPAMALTLWQLKWSPDGRHLAAAGNDPAVKVFDAATGELVRALGGHTSTVRDVAYSPDGSRLASAGLDGTVHLWDTASGRQILAFEMGGPVLAVAWNPDGTKLAALTESGTVKIWDAAPSE